MSSVSVLVPFVPRRPEQTLPYAGLVQWTHAVRLWQGQAQIVEPHQSFVHPAGAGFRVPTGLGVTLIPLRHPYEAALQARSVAISTGHTVVAGYGPGAPEFQASMLGRPYKSPLTAMREYLTIVRGLLDGETVEFDGSVFSCHAGLIPYPSPRVEVGAGVLRPRMAEVAGAVADVAITWLTPPTYLADTIVPALERGAEGAGRARPRVAALVPMALDGEGRDPAQLVMAGSSRHLAAGHYRDMLAKAGVELGEDPATAVLEAGAFLYGSEADIAAGLQRFFDAGADEVVLNVVGLCNLLGPEVALQELKRLLVVAEPLVSRNAGASAATARTPSTDREAAR